MLTGVNGMKKKGIISLFITLIVVVYIIMLHDTDNIKNDFKYCFTDNPKSEVINNTALYKYYNRNELFNNEIFDAKVKVRRRLVLHNFHNGVMFVKYDCEIFNNKGEHIYGSSNVYAKWYIERKNGIWEVVKVEERP